MGSHLSLTQQLIERRLLSGEEMERVAKLQLEQQAPLTRLIVELGFRHSNDRAQGFAGNAALRRISP